jgi:hypothetical protein
MAVVANPMQDSMTSGGPSQAQIGVGMSEFGATSGTDEERRGEFTS